MRNTRSRLAVWALMAAAIVFTAFGHSADASPIAWWRFEPGNFTADSSGNGNTLSNAGATSSGDVAPGAPGSGSAEFDGGDIMQTIGTLDLSPYRHIRVSWWQKVTSDAVGLPWEQTANYNSHPGAIVSSVNEYGAGGGSGNIRTPTGAIQDQFNHAHGSGNTVWEKIAVEYNLDSPTSAEVVRVFKDGALVGWNAITQPAAPAALFNDNFFIGARSGVVAGYVGKMDELKIETVSQLVAHWTMDDGSGGTAADSSGSGYDGTVNGATWTTAGKIGNALSFDGTNDYVGTTTAGVHTDAITVSAWVFPTGYKPYVNIVGKTDGQADSSWGLLGPRGAAGSGSNNPFWFFAKSGGTTALAKSANYPLNQWYHLVATYDPVVGTDSVKLYLNGDLVDSADLTGALVAWVR